MKGENMVNAKMEEGLRLCDAVDKFGEAMQKKLLDKLDEGYAGWDEPSVFSENDLVAKFMKAVTSSKDLSKDAIDIANLAMFIWWRKKYLTVEPPTE
jgi:hypothetical protein